MDTHITKTSFLPSHIAAPIFFLAPVICTALLVLLTSTWLPVEGFVSLQLVNLIIWSQLPVSVPALVTQDVRDQALSEYQGFAGSFVRAFLLVPFLVSDESPIKSETVASLAGWAFAIVMTLIAL